MFNQGEALDVILAAVLAHSFSTPPVWPAIIAPPGFGKTSLLDLLPVKPLPRPGEEIEPGSILALDSLSPRTLISGLSDRAKPGLLERVNNAILVVRELSTLTTRTRDVRQIFGTLRRVYDGELDGAWGTGKTVKWRGRITMIMAGVRHPASLDAELGARLLIIRLRENETDFERILGVGQRKGRERYVSEALARSVTEPDVDALKRVELQAKSLATLRGTIYRDRQHEVLEAPQVEAPHRLIGQLGGLAAGLGAVWKLKPGHPRIVGTLWRVVADSIPPQRLAVLQVLAEAENALPVGDVIEDAANLSRIGTSTANYALDDLRLLDVVRHTVGPRHGRGRPPSLTSLDDHWQGVVRRLLR